ncbi:RDD family protein [Pelomonas sp. KK5]|uniref:RDD family protein n=1 Tax=Pelomonas sp. KK5 TaxID=1855730 RepID=UPI00097C8E66|nr:RDD family protein [Pelomonas sp. KK5]
MSDSVDSRFAPPVAHVDDVVGAGAEEQLATRGQRFLGALIDGVIGGGIGWLLALLPGFGFMTETGTLRFKAIGVGIVVFLLVQGWLLVTQGQTVGKKLLGMRIVRSDGSAADAGRILGLRYGIGIVLQLNPVLGGLYGLVDGLLIFRSSRQCLHDTIADTKVIKL